MSSPEAGASLREPAVDYGALWFARCSIDDIARVVFSLGQHPALGEYEQAAEMVGAASTLREAMLVPVWGPRLERREGLVATLRAALGDDRFSAAQALGRTQPVEFFIPADVDATIASG